MFGFTRWAIVVAFEHELAQQLQSLRRQQSGEKAHARDVAARPIEAGDEAVPDRVAPVKTIGTVVVAAFAACAEGVPRPAEDLIARAGLFQQRSCGG